MKQLIAVKGSRRQRMFIYAQTILLGFLFYWALCFLIEDVTRLPAPDFTAITNQHISKPLTDQVTELQNQTQLLSTQLDMLTTQRDKLHQSTESLKVTLAQLDEQEKIRLQTSKELSADEQKTKAATMALFLENQHKDQELAQTIIKLTTQQQALRNQLSTVNTTIGKQRGPADKAYYNEMRRYSLIVASIQIAILTVILLISAFLIRRYQNSKYKPILLALFVAAFVKTVFVLHKYFPTAYFKYILIAALIAITIKLLIKAITIAESTQLAVLLKRYRDAYTYFVCPICEFPIRRGPMKFLYWTRRSITNLPVQSAVSTEKDAPYTCPVCSTALFAKCNYCEGIRHALLPSCEHCGDKETITVEPTQK